MSIASEIQRIKTNIANAYTSASNKGATLPATQNSSNLASTIDTIQTGGTPTTVEWKDVNFIDYDGTLLYSYTLAELQALSSLPTKPSHAGLTCQEWNWTLADLKTENKKMIVGATYTTNDGTSKINIEITDIADKDMQLFLAVTTNTKPVQIDWGDNSATSTVSGVNASTFTHTYSSTGNYTITISSTTGGTLKLTGNSATSMFGSGNSNSRRYGSKVKSIFFGDTLGSVGSYSFTWSGVEFLTFPKGITIPGSTVFANCRNLKALVFPSGLTNTLNTFTGCYSIKYISIPKSITATPSSLFSGGCYSLKAITLPNSITGLGTQTIFNNCYTIEEAILPTTITTAPSTLFYNCYVLKEATLPSGITSVGQNTYYGCHNITKITVPSGVTTLPNNFITSCSSLDTLTVLGNITSIGTYFLRYCYALKKVDLTHCTAVPSLRSKCF